MNTSALKKVCIVQRVLTKYRVPFFEKLRSDLRGHGIDLSLIHGQGGEGDRQRGYLAELDWAVQMPEKYWSLGNSQLVWQPYRSYLKDMDMIVVGQEMKLLLNYWLFMTRRTGHFQLALWGHQINHQERANSFRNNVKQRLNNAADWWFVYTMQEGRALQANGFSSEKITVVQNSIDTKALTDVRDTISQSDVNQLKDSLNIPVNACVGLFCGGMYPEKRLGFLIEACRGIRQAVPDFHMIFIGDGVDADIVRKAAAEDEWIHYVGPVYDDDKKVPYFMMADAMLHPGLVGLAVLDGFALSVPMITTQYPFHSPEIDYLESGHNGIMTNNALQAYGTEVVEFFRNKDLQMRLKRGCVETVASYSTERMVENFSVGICSCLGVGKGLV